MTADDWPGGCDGEFSAAPPRQESAVRRVISPGAGRSTPIRHYPPSQWQQHCGDGPAGDVRRHVARIVAMAPWSVALMEFIKHADDPGNDYQQHGDSPPVSPPPGGCPPGAHGHPKQQMTGCEKHRVHYLVTMVNRRPGNAANRGQDEQENAPCRISACPEQRPAAEITKPGRHRHRRQPTNPCEAPLPCARSATA